MSFYTHRDPLFTFMWCQNRRCKTFSVFKCILVYKQSSFFTITIIDIPIDGLFKSTTTADVYMFLISWCDSLCYDISLVDKWNISIIDISVLESFFPNTEYNLWLQKSKWISQGSNSTKEENLREKREKMREKGFSFFET